ncbi:serine/threonine-protein kinase [Paucibacter sp. B2R-40]|uniref:serine/threonine-protein kinase n=1 Tax=Paucibacter sp. B2R-40 TaxID=2893554 RepID=UPI0021E37308|nr:serine/threonine-protein kinase [Paucibacter sp. B2R-40]MCV2356864.1 serine/threonine-protein kinase [Paucibacter sp. B2R-40]
MIPSHWQTLQPHLDAVLDAPSSARATLLEQLRAQDPALAAELQVLLQAHAEGEHASFLERPAAGSVFSTPLAGQRLGAWRLLQLIGEGGMGSVWLAERDDGRFRGQAAVKLLNLSLASSHAAERFQREGQILARLAHPHIGRLLDAGITSQGQPYLVLEHVQGLPIDRYASEHGLDLRARLQLMIALLDAVAHAHRHLIVHRDLKPANVLVSEDGQVKLLDFGIAKLLDADPDETLPTQRAEARLTPGYAAPEQLQDSGVTTATDVYALGLLLQLLLTGRHPYLMPGMGLAALLRAALEAPLPKPSAQLAEGWLPGYSRAKLSRALRGDLDNIISKALQRDPARRYAAAADMADDLRRHLAHRPVRARAPSLAYVLGRGLQRHRLPLALLALGLAGSSVAGLQAWRQQQAARLSTERAQAVDGLLQSLFAGMAPENAANRQFSARELLDRGQAYLATEAALDPGTRRSVVRRMAQLYQDIGALEPALSNWQAALKSAEAAGEPAAQAELLWRLADAQIKGERPDDAARTLARLAGPLAQARPDLPGRALLLQAEMAMNSGRLPEAQADFARAEQLLRQAGVTEAEWLAWAAQGQGTTARMNGQMQAAREHLMRAVQLNLQRGSAGTVERLNAEMQLGTLDAWAGRFADGADQLARSHAEMLQRLGPDHSLTVSTVSELAYATLRLGRFEQTQQWIERLRGGGGGGGGGPGDAWRTPHAELLAARVLIYQGRSAQAVPELRRLLAGAEQREGHSSRTEQIRRFLGEALLRSGQPAWLAEATAVLQTTLEQQIALTSAKHSSTAATRVLLGCARARAGQLAQARALWAEAEPLLAGSLGAEHPFTQVARAYLAQAEGRAISPADRDALRLQIGSQADAPRWLDWLARPASSHSPLPWAELPVVL